MSHEPTPGVESEADSQPASTDSREPDWVAESTEPSEGISLVDPLLYAPLLLVGTVLVVIPEPATTLLGVGCLAAGIGLAALDFRSSSD
ncbi:MAG: hypothetical protein R6V31_04810 [Halohasta sp.]